MIGDELGGVGAEDHESGAGGALVDGADQGTEVLGAAHGGARHGILGVVRVGQTG